MSDDMKYTKHEEEYQFPSDGDYIDDESTDDDAVVQEGEASVSDNNESSVGANNVQSKMKEIVIDISERFPIVKNKKVLSVLGLVLIVMLFLHFGHSSNSSNSVNTDAMNANSAPVSTSEVSQVQSSMKALSSQEAATTTTVNSLKGQVDRIDSSIGSLQQSQRVTNTNIRQLTEQLKAVNVQLAEVAKIQDKLVHPKSEEAVKKPKPVVFHLRAVSSGRAWIIDSNGVSETVIVGSTVNKNYGTVTGIDSDQGMVYTSSKKVISFGASNY